MNNPTVSNTVFHFTGIKDSQRGIFKPDHESFNTLKTILSSREFLMKPHKRQLANSKGQSCADTIWMSCFTETPLGFLRSHVDVFGKFGIGINIRWAKRLNAQNVIYVDSGHVPPIVEQEINRGIIGIMEFSKFFKNLPPEYKNGVTKGDPYFDKIPNPEYPTNILGTTESYIYREEREWRVFGRGDHSKLLFTPKFDYTDVDCLVCPSDFVKDLVAFIKFELNTEPIKIVETETLT